MSNPLLDLPITFEEWEMGRTWYQHMADRVDVVGTRLGYHPAVSIAVFAAISPGMGPDNNLAWATWVMQTSDRFDEAERPEGLPLPYGWRNIYQASQIAQQHDPSLLTGVKRIAFYRALMGDEESVVLDVHAIKPFGLTKVDQLTSGLRTHLTMCYDELADKMNEAPRSAQAAVWCHIRLKAW